MHSSGSSARQRRSNDQNQQGTPLMDALRRGMDIEQRFSTDNDRLGIKTFLAAVLMFFGSVIMLGIGLNIYLNSTHETKHNGLELIVIGAVLFLPGTYGMISLIGTHYGWPGYRYENLPSYDPDE